MHWEEEAYSRTDADGNPVSMVILKYSLLRKHELRLEFGQVEYEEKALEKRLSRWHIMSKGDLSLYAMTGYNFLVMVKDKTLTRIVLDSSSTLTTSSSSI